VFTYVYSRYALCLLLQILFVAVLDIKTRDVPMLVNKLVAVTILQSFAFFCKFLCCTGGGRGAPTVRFAPVVPWAKTGPVRIGP
jgi:hypothetical protein